MIAAPVRRVHWYTQIAPVATVIAAVLLDLSMPNVGGEKALTQIHARYADLPVVLTSCAYACWNVSALPDIVACV